MKSLTVRKLPFAILFLMVAGIAKSSNAQLSFSNPLIDFDSIICVARGQNTIIHVCDQYFGCFAIPGGSIYIVSGFKNGSRKVTDLLANATVQSGRYSGKKLSGGAFISPDLSYDGNTVVFGWKASGGPTGSSTFNQDVCFHIFKINIDGTGLVQLTDGKWDDFDPCWLPSGRIVFVSERRGGFGRCHPRQVPTYTLHSMKDDGSDIIAISYHETNEWHPSVDNNGKILYSRWDYVDRDDCIAHHPWTCEPDGCNPRSYHGNYPLPNTTLTGSNWPDGRNFRPWSELNCRAIPNSNKFIATGAGHHTQSFGQLIIVNPDIADDGKMAQITNITAPGRTTWGDNEGPWATAWPLSEDYYLASYNGDIVFMNKSAQTLMLCPRSATPAANLANFKLIDPIPVQPRTPPPNKPVQTYEGERAKLPHQSARISVKNVYESDLPFPTGVKIKWIRVVQVSPKSTVLINDPRVCFASEATCRLPLGIVPVESDGSAYFEAPVDRILLFQALDSNFMAVQSMRSDTYVHKGEHLTCTGCHEDKWKSMPSLDPIADKRAPSKLQTEFKEALPMSFYRCAKPVFDSKCASCHSQQGKGPNMSYSSLKQYLFYFCGDGWPYTNGNINEAKVGGSRTIPGNFGARASSLYTHCNASHHSVSLTKDELHRITLWLDCNSNELGSEQNVNGQKNGQLVWPALDIDTSNILGIEPSTTAIQASAVAPTASVASKYSICSVGGHLKLDGACASAHRVEIFNAHGRRLANFSGAGNIHYSVPTSTLGAGLLVVHVEADGKKYVGAVPVTGK